MSAWRREALRLLPELRSVITAASSPMALWIEINLAFDSAFEGKRLEFLQRVLEYARWASSEKSGVLPNDSSTAAALAFFEHLPENRTRWDWMKKSLTPKEFEGLIPVFSYHLEAEQVQELTNYYRQKSPKR